MLPRRSTSLRLRVTHESFRIDHKEASEEGGAGERGPGVEFRGVREEANPDHEAV